MRRFNTTGTCFPDEHYMVDISEQVNIAEQMVIDNYYFCINKGRQYGKTTTLYALGNQLESHGYTVFSLSFERLSDESFKSLETIFAKVLWQIFELADNDNLPNISDYSKELIIKNYTFDMKEISVEQFSSILNKICKKDKIVLIIDEVDQASNYESFIKFLGFLRDRYLNRVKVPTFQSVILAGVYNIKNLKLKIRPESEHQYNSPWNIAEPYSAKMGLPESGIAKMLSEFKADYKLDINENEVAKAIFGWTNGYSYLVSKICKFIVENNLPWNEEGVNIAVRDILKDREDSLLCFIMIEIQDNKELFDIVERIINGDYIIFNPREKSINLGLTLGIISPREGGGIMISNSIFENRIFNYLNCLKEMSKFSA